MRWFPTDARQGSGCFPCTAATPGLDSPAGFSAQLLHQSVAASHVLAHKHHPIPSLAGDKRLQHKSSLDMLFTRSHRSSCMTTPTLLTRSCTMFSENRLFNYICISKAFSPHLQPLICVAASLKWIPVLKKTIVRALKGDLVER